MVRRLLPWHHPPECDEAIRAEARAARREAEELAPVDAAQADYLERRGTLNGFTRQLRIGFRERIAGE